MARGFNTTLGNSPNDIITTALSTNYTQRSWFIWGFHRNTAASTILWRQQNGGGLVSQMYYDSSDQTYRHYRHYTGDDGVWGIAIPAAGTWFSLGLSRDESAASNLPVFYLNNTKPSFTTYVTPTGTPESMASAPMYVGNDPSLTTCWDGVLVEFAVWDTILTDGEFFALCMGIRPYNIRFGSLVGYWTLDGLTSPEPDLSGKTGTATVSGTKFATGAPITTFTPRWPSNIIIPAAAAASIPFTQIAAHITRRNTYIGY